MAEPGTPCGGQVGLGLCSQRAPRNPVREASPGTEVLYWLVVGDYCPHHLSFHPSLGGPKERWDICQLTNIIGMTPVLCTWPRALTPFLSLSFLCLSGFLSASAFPPSLHRHVCLSLSLSYSPLLPFPTQRLTHDKHSTNIFLTSYYAKSQTDTKVAE